MKKRYLVTGKALRSNHALSLANEIFVNSKSNLNQDQNNFFSSFSALKVQINIEHMHV